MTLTASQLSSHPGVMVLAKKTGLAGGSPMTSTGGETLSSPDGREFVAVAMAINETDENL